MPRPRTASDTEVLAGALRALTSQGPAQLTLADVAHEVGLAPATLVQRFGSKRGLLLAVAEIWASVVPRHFEWAQTNHDSALEALLAALLATTRGLRTRRAVANYLAFIELGLGDSGFRRHALEHARAVETGVRDLLDHAVEQGELARCDTADLARVIHVMYSGVLATWAVSRHTSLAGALRANVGWLLDPMRPGSGRTGASGRARARL